MEVCFNCQGELYINNFRYFQTEYWFKDKEKTKLVANMEPFCHKCIEIGRSMGYKKFEDIMSGFQGEVVKLDLGEIK